MLEILLIVALGILVAQGLTIRLLLKVEKKRRQEFRYLESVCLYGAADARSARREIEFLQEEIRRLLEPTKPLTPEERERISGEVTEEQMLETATECARYTFPER